MGEGVNPDAFESLKTDVHHLKAAVIKLTDVMVEQVAIEERQIQHSEALERAFTDLKDLRSWLSAEEKERTLQSEDIRGRIIRLEENIKGPQKMVAIFIGVVSAVLCAAAAAWVIGS